MLGRAPVAVIAVGDCNPAAAALNAASSGAAAIRALLGHARDLKRQWLVVSVPRGTWTPTALATQHTSSQ
eukprot:2803957-Pleurochrysis_carterae.AAC.1